MGQGSLAETLVSAKLGQNQRLERIDRAVAWDRLDKLVEGVYSAKEGRPSYPPLMMVKVLLLDEMAVYGDRAYQSKRRRDWLKSQGIKDRTMNRANKHQPVLSHWQQRRNELISPIRSKVEKVFGTLKRSYGYQRVRYVGLSATPWRCGSS